MQIPATDLKPGDIVHYDDRCYWEVERVWTKGKSVYINGTYARWDWPSDRKGEAINHRFRQSTVLTVTR